MNSSTAPWYARTRELTHAYVNPVVAVMLGVLIAHEQLDIYTFIALPILLLGVTLVAVALK